MHFLNERGGDEVANSFCNTLQCCRSLWIYWIQIYILEVEKRRIYDIVNVMEALGAMEKANKSFYRWRGMDGLPGLLDSLKVSFGFKCTVLKLLAVLEVYSSLS